MNTVDIKTTQNVSIQYEVASLGDRYLAAIIDWVVVAMYVIGASLLFYALNMDFSFTPLSIIFNLMVFLPVAFYHLLCELIFEGQSFGKHLMKIKVVSIDGTQVTFGSYLIRWLMRLVDITLSTGGIAVATIIINGKGQRLGDIAAGTTIVNTKKRTLFDASIYSPTQTDYQVIFPEVQKLTDKDIGIIKQVLDARLQLDGQSVINKTADKVFTLLGLENTELSAFQFLQTVIKDYNHLNS